MGIHYNRLSKLLGVCKDLDLAVKTDSRNLILVLFFLFFLFLVFKKVNRKKTDILKKSLKGGVRGPGNSNLWPDKPVFKFCNETAKYILNL